MLLPKFIAFGVGDNFSWFISSFLRYLTTQAAIDGISSSKPQVSIPSHILLIIFLNDLLCITFSPIGSLADDSSICHLYSYLVSWLSHDIVTISGRSQAIRAGFQPRKTQYCMLTYNRSTECTASYVISTLYIIPCFGAIHCMNQDLAKLISIRLRTDGHR